MGHDCPTCEVDVYGYLKTKIYCSDQCRSKFNKLKEKQLIHPCEGFNEFQKKNYEVLNSVMGDSKSFFISSLFKLQKKNFRPAEYCSKAFYRGMRVYVVGAYSYYVKYDLIFVFRTSEVDGLFEGIEARWRLDFPELAASIDSEVIIKGTVRRLGKDDILVLRNEFFRLVWSSYYSKIGVLRI